MDISLPLMDGREAIEILKGDEQTKAIPIVAFTAHSLGEDQCLRSCRCDGYLIKPFEAAELLDQVRRFVNQE
jgi:CheY-like chemotaxis protein